MPLLDIDFTKIRPHRGSQDRGFEELCTQLASLEPRGPTVDFYRKGTGADAGIECFIRDASGSETGWQAKYFFKFQSSQVQQLDESIQQALSKHPSLTKFIVCLPFNLKDARRSKTQKTELDRWREWVSKWTKHARKKYKRTIEIELWDASALTERLSRKDARYEGRIAFWFNETSLTREWFKQKFEVGRAGLGERYTPETNIELPIRKSILAFCRDPFVYDFIERSSGKIDEEATGAIEAIRHLKQAGFDTLAADLEAKCEALLAALSKCTPDPSAAYPIDALISLGVEVNRAVSAASSAVWKFKAVDKNDTDAIRSAEYHVRQFSNKLHDFLDELSGENWAIANTRELLLYGDAGMGKSHLLADAVSHQIERGRPALLILGSTLREADPWTQIIEQLGIQGTSTEQFLAALDAAGQAAGCRAVVVIDAINERHGIALWATRLPSFLKSIAAFPHVGIAVSCRTTYLPHIVDANAQLKTLRRVKHIGFAGNAAAANYYLDKRGIVRMSAPSFEPEFDNPLFLKTCCDFLNKSGKNEIPRSLRGVVSIFDFYSGAVAQSIERRMGLDAKQNIVRRALAALSEIFEAGDRGYADIAAALAAMEAIHPSRGLAEQSLIQQLESEGVIAIEPVQDDHGKLVEQVRFTFERYSDFRIASRLLEQHFNASDPKASFANGTTLRAYLEDDKAYTRAGVVEAMSTLVPESSGIELIDAVGKSDASYILTDAFITSVLWREQKHFTQRTFDLLKEASRFSGRDEMMSALIAVATEPDNPFNAKYLHDRLKNLSMPERDKRWTTYLVQDQGDEGSSFETLISWALQNGLGTIDDSRAELAATCLSWSFTTSDRAMRDRATKALASLLSVRLHLAAKLVDKFANVNDFYVLERVLASAYGAALQGLTTSWLAELATASFNCVFAVDPPVQHLLIRDYARGIAELAAHKGVLPTTINIARVRPPYKGSQPIEDVPEELIETYKQDYGKGVFRDEIVSSAVNDGDFARYIIDNSVDDWSTFPISFAGLSKEDLFARWSEKCVAAHQDAATLLLELMRAATELQAIRARDPFPELRIVFVAPGEKVDEEDKRSPELRAAEERRNRAEEQLHSLIGDELWSDYADHARPFLFDNGRGGWWPPRFDSKNARRWVCKRAHDLGWTPELFGDFERNLNSDYSRMNHRLERIGKKYQWIALYELLARISDNQLFIGGYGDEPKAYKGPWQISRRDIDPSLLAASTHDDAWRQWEKCWWMPVDLKLRSISPVSRLRWLNGPDDFLRDQQLIDVIDPEGKKWIVLEEVAVWHQWALNDGDRNLERTAWFRLQCMIVKANEFEKLIETLSGEMVTDEHDLPTFPFPWRAFIGEYPWHPVFQETDYEGARFKVPKSMRPVIASYSAEKGGYDYSIDESFSLDLPSPDVISGMGLHLSNGRELSYQDSSGVVRFLDPSVKQEGPSAALVDAEAFNAFLKREGLVAVWAIGGMKSVYSGNRRHEGWGGERLFSTLLWRDGKSFKRKDRFEYRKPRRNQLETFLAGEPQDEIDLILSSYKNELGDSETPGKRINVSKKAFEKPARSKKKQAAKSTARPKRVPKKTKRSIKVKKRGTISRRAKARPKK